MIEESYTVRVVGFMTVYADSDRDALNKVSDRLAEANIEDTLTIGSLEIPKFSELVNDDYS